MREGTRVASIETGLAAAAAKLSQQVRLPETQAMKALSPSSRVLSEEQRSARPPWGLFMPVSGEIKGMEGSRLSQHTCQHHSTEQAMCWSCREHSC